MKYIDGAEVAKHASKSSCWLAIDSDVYDVTEFLEDHPGGAPIILKQAGTDASAAFKKYHPLKYLTDYLAKDALIATLNPATVGQLRQLSDEKPRKPAAATDSADCVPHLSMCVVLSDFEKAAKAVMSHKTYTYTSASANAGLSFRGNVDDWGRVKFRGRVMRNVGDVDTRRKIFGHDSPCPFYISPMGTMGGTHPGGEHEMFRGAQRKGVHAVLSTVSSNSSDEVMQTFKEGHRRLGGKSPSTLFFQLYMPPDRRKAVELLRSVMKAGYKGLWLTVDTPVLGKRTSDRYLQAEDAIAVGLGEEGAPDDVYAPTGGASAPLAQLSPYTTWEDLVWVRREWDGPIVLKGLSSWEDAKLAVQHGCQGIVLSNHGGRQMHTAPSALLTLCEIRTYYPQALEKLEIFVDGGLRDGSDILKAICLGATAVGIGRPFLYALGAYGAKGVERCVDILVEELQIGMRLLGVTSLDQCQPEMVNATRLLNEMWRPNQVSVQSKL